MVINIKTFSEIYENIKNKFFELTEVDIAPRSIIDMIIKAVSDSMETIYQTIEDNKQPYLFTKQKGEELDDTGFFLNCPRVDGESDENYMYRLSKWTQRNASSNRQSIEDVGRTLLYSSAANYIPYTHGIGTATIYLIPLDYNEDSQEIAISEAKEKFSKVISPTSIVYYEVAKPCLIRLVVYLDVKQGYDLTNIKIQIKKTLEGYINGIEPGKLLLLGEINKLGLSIDGVEYFNIVQTYTDNEEVTDFELLQTLTAKFLLEDIIYWDVEG